MGVPPIKFAHVRRGKVDAPPGLVGVARVDRRFITTNQTLVSNGSNVTANGTFSTNNLLRDLI